MKITVTQAAKAMHKCPMFVRLALQNGSLPFGFAQKTPGKERYSYYICEEQFRQFVGEKEYKALEAEK